MENFPGKGIRNKQVSDTEFSINFTIYEKAFIPNWTSVERRLLSISWKKITQSAFPSAGHSLILKLPSSRHSSETIM